MNEYCGKEQCLKVDIKKGYHIIGYDLTGVKMELKNPLISIYNHYDSLFQIDEVYFRASKDQSVFEIRRNVDHIVKESDFTFNKSKVYMEMYENNLKTTATKLIMQILNLSLVIISIIYLILYMYLDHYKYELAVKYVNGWSRWQRYKHILELNFITDVISFILAVLFIDVAMMNLFIYFIAIVMIEYVISIYIIKKFEKKSMVQILKGDDEL